MGTRAFKPQTSALFGISFSSNLAVGLKKENVLDRVTVMHELYNRFIQLSCQARTPVRLDASGRWFICLTVFRVGHEVEGTLKASGLLPFFQTLWDILDLQKYPKTVFQVSRFRKRVLDDSLAIPGVPNFIAFEGVPLVFAKFGVPSRETSADWCAAEKHVKDWLASEGATTHSLTQPVACPEELPHEAPGGQACGRSLAEYPRSPRSTPQEASDDGLVSHAADKEAVSRFLQHKTHEQLVDHVCAVGTEHQQHTDALSKQLVCQERLCAMQQAQLQQLKRKCGCLGRELAQAREAWAESCLGERHGRRYFSPRQGLLLRHGLLPPIPL